MLAAIPIQIVETSGLMNLIVSYIARPAVVDPPGELIYKEVPLPKEFQDYLDELDKDI